MLILVLVMAVMSALVGYVLFMTLGWLATLLLSGYVIYVLYHIYGDSPFD